MRHIKCAVLTNFLKKEGIEVKVILTEATQKFITPLTFQTLSGNTVYMDTFKIIGTAQVEHFSLAMRHFGLDKEIVKIWCSILKIIIPKNALIKTFFGISTIRICAKA